MVASMNNKPVAWIPFAWYCAWLGKDDEPVLEQYEECHPATKQWDNFPDKIIPLYTHPVKEPMMVLDGNRVYPAFKELTDGEIQEISHQYHYTYNPDYVGFARAILRKAQEK